MNPTPKQAKRAGKAPAHKRAGQVERAVARVSQANRPALEAHVERCRGQEAMSENGVYSFVRPIQFADTILQGKALKECRAEDFARVMATFRRVYNAGSLRVRALNLRKHVRYCHGVIRTGSAQPTLLEAAGLSKQEAKAIEDALYVKRVKPAVVGQVIDDADYAAILRHLKPRVSLQPAFALEVRDRAVFSTLRRTGFRVAEALSLRLSGVRREVINGQPCYKLALDGREEALGKLKTGPRTIYVADVDVVEALDAWLRVHPFRQDPDAYLFVTADTGGHMRPFSTEACRLTLAKALDWAGILQKYPAPLTPHDFRHTCATEKADGGWNVFQLCDYFGWGEDSRMPFLYVHNSLAKQRARILADAQKAAQAATIAIPGDLSAVNALVALVQQAAAKMGTANA